jgi:glycosyltransferase involved in cell wall biosynthesis
MNLGIEALSLNSPGGIKHLNELLRYAKYSKNKFEAIYIWGNYNSLEKIKSQKKIHKIYIDFLNFNIFKKIIYHLFYLPREIKSKNCNIVLCLSNIIFIKNILYVTLFQNLLPFSLNEYYKFSFKYKIKLYFQRIFYKYTISNAAGIIFLTRNSKKIVNKFIKKKNSVIIPHGIDKDFFINKSDEHLKIKILYPSNIIPYKNHDVVIKAISILEKKKIKISIVFAGNYLNYYYNQLQNLINKLNINKKIIKFYALLSKANLIKKYKECNLVVYASSCEAFGLGLAESMLTNRPIIAAKTSNNLEILGSRGHYYESNDPIKLANLILRLHKNIKLKKNNAKKPNKIFQNYSWKNSSVSTFKFLASIKK